MASSHLTLDTRCRCCRHKTVSLEQKGGWGNPYTPLQNKLKMFILITMPRLWMRKFLGTGVVQAPVQRLSNQLQGLFPHSRAAIPPELNQTHSLTHFFFFGSFSLKKKNSWWLWFASLRRFNPPPLNIMSSSPQMERRWAKPCANPCCRVFY